MNKRCQLDCKITGCLELNYIFQHCLVIASVCLAEPLQVQSQVMQKETKEEFTLFSDHSGILLRPGAHTSHAILQQHTNRKTTQPGSNAHVSCPQAESHDSV